MTTSSGWAVDAGRRQVFTCFDRRAARLGERSVNRRFLPPLVNARALLPVWWQVCRSDCQPVTGGASSNGG
ncbi:hypothetical protein LJP45_001733 [Salmonella enterica]|nr:hypothetical protein [Salmonella enterica]